MDIAARLGRGSAFGAVIFSAGLAFVADELSKGYGAFVIDAIIGALGVSVLVGVVVAIRIAL